MEIKPCPFCGGKVRLDTAYSYFRDTVIYCDGCDMVYTLDDCSTTKEQIAEAWNRRYGDDSANADGDKELQAKLRNNFAEWCKKNGRTPLNPQAVQDWWNENVQWRNYNE